MDKTIKTIKNEKAKNPKIIKSMPKKFLSKSLEEKLYKRKENMNIIINKTRFLHARLTLSLMRAGPLTALVFEIVFFVLPLFFLAIFNII